MIPSTLSGMGSGWSDIDHRSGGRSHGELMTADPLFRSIYAG
jgi:hypothetical protein